MDATPPHKGAVPNASWMASFPFLTSLCVALTPQLPIPQIAATPVHVTVKARHAPPQGP